MTTIAIDGPSGSGKSTLGRLLAERLGLECLDTGAMYRSVAYLALAQGIPLDDGEVLAELARSMVIAIGRTVVLNGDDVTAAIRSPEVTSAVSAVAAQQVVRNELVARQRSWVAERGGGVVEGRDIGSVVLPDADVKVFLTAGVHERARRRAEESAEEGGGGAVETYVESMTARDRKDATRSVSPLHAVDDALTIDSTTMTPDAIADLVLETLAERTRVPTVPRSPRTSERDPDASGDRPVRSADGRSRAVRYPGRGELAFYAICRTIVMAISRCYYPGRVDGAERLPRTGAYILAPVHRSYVDWLVAARVTRRRLRFVVKAEIWKVPALGRFIELLGAFPVHRGIADREALSRCLEVLAVGEPLVVFPEGTRQRGREVTELLDGAAYMALRAGVPIFPLGLAGTEEAMPRGSRVPRPRRVRLVIGPPVVPERPDPTRRVGRRETTELTGELRDAIQRATDDAASALSGSPGGTGTPPLSHAPGTGSAHEE